MQSCDMETAPPLESPGEFNRMASYKDQQHSNPHVAVRNHFHDWSCSRDSVLGRARGGLHSKAGGGSVPNISNKVKAQNSETMH